MEAILNFVTSTGFYQFTQDGNWKCLVMIAVACVLLYLGIVKKFEPLLLVPIAFGMLVTNLPGAEMYHEILFAGGHIHWDLIGGAPITAEFLSEMSAARCLGGDSRHGQRGRNDLPWASSTFSTWASNWASIRA